MTDKKKPRLVNILDIKKLAEAGEIQVYSEDSPPPDPPERVKGHITTEHTVWCGNCTEWLQISGSMAECVAMFRAYGWIRTRKDGWLCPGCKHDK